MGLSVRPLRLSIFGGFNVLIGTVARMLIKDEIPCYSNCGLPNCDLTSWLRRRNGGEGSGVLALELVSAPRPSLSAPGEGDTTGATLGVVGVTSSGLTGTSSMGSACGRAAAVATGRTC